ncbi:MAG: hypothetical protein U0941_17855 [Planctomycetaceae bacterium]
MNSFYPRCIAGLAVLLTNSCLVLSASPVNADEIFSSKPRVQIVNGQATLMFGVAKPIDVEIAVIDASELIVRHLAAGTLGMEQGPPAPLVRGLTQNLAWDGLDDDGQTARGGPFRFRVRTGMSVKLDAVAGGDPYAFWTEYSGQGDHAQWRITGLEAKRDGSVFLFGNLTPYGLPTLRQYDARGNFRCTVFPPPAGKPVEEVRGWGVNERTDGTWTLRPKYGWSSLASEWTLMVSGDGTRSGRLVPTQDADSLTLVTLPGEGNQRMQFGVDGTLKEFSPAAFLGGDPLPKTGLIRSFFTAPTPDGKSLYVSGVSTLREGFWREGQVWKIDLATRTTSVFFSLTEEERKDRAAIGHTDASPYSALQGVAVDREGRLFICDRMNRRVLIVGTDGNVIRSLPVANPDAVATCPRSKAVYVTTRFGNYSGNGKLELLKFADWSQDDTPAVTMPLRDRIGSRQESSLVTVVEDNGEILVWVAYTQLPVRIFKDTGNKLELIKDFYEAGSQRSLDLQHMTLDPKTGHIYIADSQNFLFRMRDWTNPVFEPCLSDAKTRIQAGSIAIDARSRFLYTKHHYNKPVLRWNLDGEYFTPAPVAGSQAVVPPVTCAWVFTGLWERGMAACPEGFATLGVVLTPGARIDDYRGPLTYFAPDSTRTPWNGLKFAGFGGNSPNSGGIVFDRQGRLYAGLHDGKPNNIPPGFEKDNDYLAKMGRIYRYDPTGTKASGNLFPTEPTAPARIYDINYGPLVHAPRFTVDAYGRIYYPNGLLPQIGVIDNEGNRIMAFGTWGNRDSLGGLPGDLVPTADIPLAWPNSVDADDNFVYVSDMLNARLLRLRKNYANTDSVSLQVD